MMNAKKWLSKNIWIWSVVGSIILWIVICLMKNKIIFSLLLSNATLASFLILLSLGQMTVLTSGGGAIDLSIQYTIALGAYLSSILMRSIGFVPGLVLTLLTCAFVGILNGSVNLFLGIPPMITTLSVGYIVYSTVLKISSTTTAPPIRILANFTQKIRIAGMSPLIFVALFTSLVMWFLMRKTAYGKDLHAVGQNRTAARMAGINVTKTVMLAFVINSFLAGVAGTLLGGYSGGAFQDIGLSYMLPCIAAAAIGGTSVAGGRSSVIGSVAGAFLLTLITSFLNLTGLAASYQRLIQGTLLIVILIASRPQTEGRKKKKKVKIELENA